MKHPHSTPTQSGYCQTPWGWAYLEYDDHTIYRLELLGGKRYPLKNGIAANETVQKVVDKLFKNPTHFELRPQGTAFQQSVWNALLTIPKGTLRTYLDIAKAIKRPKSVRAVANAVGANPICIFIPCHRVIRSDGTLGGYSSGSGAHLKKELLKAEGINPPSEGPSCESPSTF